MNRAIVTLAIGQHRELLKIARPSFMAFAMRHGYDLRISVDDIACARPPAWYKLPLLKAALDTYDEVLFLGADIVIVDGSEDLPQVPPEYWQAMVKHNTGDGEVPNTEVWMVRKPMAEWLSRAWDLTQWTNHGWWEQAAIIDLMGYEIGTRPQSRHKIDTELYKHTYFYSNEWNVHAWDCPQPEHPRIQHATMYPDRAAIMREWAAQAEGWINGENGTQ